MKIIGFNIEEKDNAAAAFAIRQKVFVEEQKVNREEEYDEHEYSASHYLVLIDEQPVATARWRFTDKGIKLERFSVLPEFRNQGIGSALVNHILTTVTPHQKLIYLHAQVAAMNVYARNGFEAEGELFYEANIPHYKMIYSLSK
ncbi:MAG: GNAT family N-acetyltransferase [Bacteroidota bacterium]